MNIIPRSLAFVLCLVLRVSSQPPAKPIGEWSPNRADAYPNPWVDSEKCKTLETSGLCDYNQMLTVEQSKHLLLLLLFEREPVVPSTFLSLLQVSRELEFETSSLERQITGLLISIVAEQRKKG